MTDTVQIHNGPNDEELTAEELKALFEDPMDSWGNLEIAVEFPRGGYASLHWTGFGDEDAVGSGFFVRLAGLSPLGDQDSPEILELLDGGSEPFDATARHLLRAEDACWLAWQLRRGVRPTRWPDGRALEWSESIVDVTPWRALGELEAPYGESMVTINCDTVSLAGADEPAWANQQALRLTKRTLPDEAAESLPSTAMWQVLRELHDVEDRRWLTLLTEHPMPWLRSLLVTLDELDGLAEAVSVQPRLRDLLVHSRAAVVPAISSDSLVALLLEGMEAPAVAAFLRASRLPALQVLVISSDAIAAPLDFSRLPEGVVVHLEFAEDDDLGLLRNTTSARSLALALKDESSAEDLVRGLAARAGLTTWVSTLWPHAEQAVALARAQGLELEMR